MGLREVEARPPVTDAELIEWEARVRLTDDDLTELVLRLIAEVRRLRAQALTAVEPIRVGTAEEPPEPPHRDTNAVTQPPKTPGEAPAIIRDPKRCAGDPILAGTRTTVHDVVRYVSLYGGDPERVREKALPHLSIEQIRAAMDWYREHTEEIDQILRECREDYERGLAARGNAR